MPKHRGPLPVLWWTHSLFGSNAFLFSSLSVMTLKFSFVGWQTWNCHLCITDFTCFVTQTRFRTNKPYSVYVRCRSPAVSQLCLRLWSPGRQKEYWLPRGLQRGRKWNFMPVLLVICLKCHELFKVLCLIKRENSTAASFRWSLFFRAFTLWIFSETWVYSKWTRRMSSLLILTSSQCMVCIHISRSPYRFSIWMPQERYCILCLATEMHLLSCSTSSLWVHRRPTSSLTLTLITGLLWGLPSKMSEINMPRVSSLFNCLKWQDACTGV